MNSSDKIIIELLQKPGLKEWVHSPSAENNLYWEKWMEKNPDKRDALLKAREFIIRLKEREGKDFHGAQLSTQEVDEILINVIGSSSSNSGQSRILFSPWVKVAAILVMALALSFVIYQLSDQQITIPEVSIVTKENQGPGKMEFKLGDGTLVHLNSYSKLSFPEKFSDSLRSVKLSGEAFFDVVTDINRPFTVNSEDVITTVLGTSFNINAYPGTGKVFVSLVSGKVAVQRAKLDAQSYLINPGEKIVFDQKSNFETISIFDPVVETGWKDGILVFEDTGFPEFLSRLEMWYGVDFLVQGNPSQTWHIEGYFDNESLEEILKGVQFTHDLTFEINGKQVVIKF